jgi:hypothetical protein
MLACTCAHHQYEACQWNGKRIVSVPPIPPTIVFAAKVGSVKNAIVRVYVSEKADDESIFESNRNTQSA